MKKTFLLINKIYLVLDQYILNIMIKSIMLNF